MLIQNVLLAGIMLSIVLLIVVLLRFWGRLNEWQEALQAFTTAPGENQPSALASFIESVSARAGYAVAMQLKTSLLGKASGESKRTAQVEEAMLQDMAGAASPLASIALQMFPTLGRKIAKNPALLDSLLKMLPRVSPGIPGTGATTPRNGDEPQLKIGV